MPSLFEGWYAKRQQRKQKPHSSDTTYPFVRNGKLVLWCWKDGEVESSFLSIEKGGWIAITGDSITSCPTCGLYLTIPDGEYRND